MGSSSFVQTSFLGGEWSANAQGRMDDPDYRRALAKCFNSFPLEEAAWTRRPGTQEGGHTRNGAAGRLTRFSFGESSPYNVEFTDGVMRFWNGPQLAADSSQAVTSVSVATPAVLTTASAVTWSTNDQIYFTLDSDEALQSVPGLAGDRQFKVTKLTTTTFELYDPVTGAAIDGSALMLPAAWVPGLAATAWRIREIVSPYTGTLWQTVREVQNDLEVLLLQGAVSPRALTAALGTPFNTFALGTPTFFDGPYMDPPAGGATLTPSAKTGTITLTASSTVGVNGGQGFLATDVGRMVRLNSQPLNWNSATSYVTNDAVKFNDVMYYALSNNSNKRPDGNPTIWSILPTLSQWSWGVITTVTSTTVVSLLIKGPDLPYVNVVTQWRLGLYSDTTGWPKVGVYYNSRLWLAGAQKNRVDGSVSNGFGAGTFYFSPTDVYGVVADDSGCAYVFNSSEANEILWLQSSGQGVVAGTNSGEWLISAGENNNTITPTNIKADPVTAYGCANVEPRRSGLSMVMVQKFGRKLIEYLPDAMTSKFYGQNLARNAKHLTVGQIKELAFQEELAPIVWQRTGSGKLVGTTYRRTSMYSSQPPEFNAWHEHELGSGRTVEYITTGQTPGEASNLETLAMVSFDPLTGVRHVEFLRKVFDEDDTLTSAWFVDAGVVPAYGRILAGTSIQFTGLHKLDNKKVAVFAGGLDCGDYTVAGGSVTVPYGAADGFLTPTYLASLTTNGMDYGDMAVSIDRRAYVIPCVVGFSYESRGQLLRPAAPQDTGAQAGPGFAKLRRGHQYGVLLQNAFKMYFGTRFDRMRIANFRTPGGKPYSPIEPFSGIHSDAIEDESSFNGQLAWKINRPYPGSVLASGLFLQTQDK